VVGDKKGVGGQREIEARKIGGQKLVGVRRKEEARKFGD